MGGSAFVEDGSEVCGSAFVEDGSEVRGSEVR